MHRKLVIASLLLVVPVASVSADTFWRNVLSSGATTGSFYLTSRKDHKVVIDAQEDASSFVASNGAIRGPYLEAALQKVRAENPGLKASDDELAQAILSAEPATAAQ
ncbi:MAG: DUF2388 domain-containing protein [Pseudomonas sp.]|uniref:DUF2388 domain-containing protein n=1 Tax=Pseudomonas sp. TaxID=306 RepID=UPI000D94E953